MDCCRCRHCVGLAEACLRVYDRQQERLRFGDVVADSDLAVKAGGVLSIFGPSGCGKSLRRGTPMRLARHQNRSLITARTVLNRTSAELLASKVPRTLADLPSALIAPRSTKRPSSPMLQLCLPYSVPAPTVQPSLLSSMDVCHDPAPTSPSVTVRLDWPLI